MKFKVLIVFIFLNNYIIFLYSVIIVIIIAIIDNIPMSKTELNPVSGIGLGIKRPFKLRKKLSPIFKLFFALGNIRKTA